MNLRLLTITGITLCCACSRAAIPVAVELRAVPPPAPKPVAVVKPVQKKAAADTALVGRIGSIIWNRTPIYDGPYRRKIYNVCSVGQPVILTGWNSQWYGVRMIDGRTGWVYRGAVQLLDATIRIPQVVQRNTTQGYTLVGVPPVLRVAFGYMGIPYRWGGTSSSGIDCSGFVRSVFRRFGVELPRVARDQAKVGLDVPLSPSYLQPGDRLYFACNHKYVDHTGIYWGGGLFIHSSGGKGVNISRLWDGGTYQKGLVAAKR